MCMITKNKNSEVNNRRIFSKKDTKCLVEYVFSKAEQKEAKKTKAQRVLEINIEKFASLKKCNITKERVESLRDSLLELDQKNEMFEIENTQVSNSKKIILKFFASVVPIALYWPLITDAIDKQIFELNTGITQIKDVVFCWLNNYFIHVPMFASISQFVDSVLLFSQKQNSYIKISFKLDGFIEQKLLQGLDEKE